MHVMFLHPNFPGQFGHIANYLSTRLGWRATYVTSVDTTHLKLPFTHINYKVKPGPQPKTFFNPDNLQGHLDHLAAVFKGLGTAPQIQPELVVGHMSYGTMLYLRLLYDCPFIGYFEYLPAPFWTDGLVMRREYPPPIDNRLFNATYHTCTYLHLHACDAGYTPTHFQLSTAPRELQHKIRVIHDGIDTVLFQRKEIPRPTVFRGITIPPGTRVVTYVSRGMESLRGFDIFMKMAKRIYQAHDDVIFLIAGGDRIHYGHENFHIGKQTFKEFVLGQDQYRLEKFHFLDHIPLNDLAVMYSLSDLHIYLTAPYILSWSLLQAMSSACTIVSSATAPVQEVIDHGVHGLLADFYDVDKLADYAIGVVRDPAAHRPLGEAARARVLERYEAGRCINQLVEYFQEVAGKYRKKAPAAENNGEKRNLP